VSFEDFSKILRQERETDFTASILPQIRRIVKDTFEAVGSRLVKPGTKADCFEVRFY